MSLKTLSTYTSTVTHNGQTLPVVLPIPIKIGVSALLVLFSFMLISQPAPTTETAKATPAIGGGVSEKLN